ALSAKCRAARKGLARSKALLASSNRASAWTIPLLAWALAAWARASAASFCASWASSVSETRRRVFEEILLTEGAQGLHEIGRPGQGLEPLGEVLPIRKSPRSALLCCRSKRRAPRD